MRYAIIAFCCCADSNNLGCLHHASWISLIKCNWTEQENGRLLTDRLEKVASNLPITDGKRLIIKLFLKSHPIDDIGNALLPEDVLNLTI